MAEVIHVDREAAWAVRSAPYMDEICRDRWMAGVYDNVPGSRIQAFARHRTEAVKPLVDTNQRARAILSERSGAAYQFDWDIQVISLVAAEKAITSAREEALREAAEICDQYAAAARNPTPSGGISYGTALKIQRSILSLITGGGGYDAD